MWQNCRRRISGQYRRIYGAESSFTKKQKIYCTLQAAGITIFLGLFFYRTPRAVPFMIPVGVYYLGMLEEKKGKEKRGRMRDQFKDAILSIAAGLRAGYAVENAFRETLKEMRQLHGRESLIYGELYKVVQGLDNQISVEELMRQFAERTKLEEIQEFADVFAIAKRSGGNLTEIIYETATAIGGKIDVEKEVQVTISAKRLEQNIMTVIPFAIICYVSAASGGYFDVLYEAPVGRLIMTVCLVIYMTAYVMGRKITEIQV